MRLSLEAKIVFSWMAALLASIAIVTAVDLLRLERLPSLAISLLLALPAGLALLMPVTRPLNKSLRSLETGLLNFKDNDFSTSLAVTRRDELGALASLYNEVSDLLRRERQHLYQRELLLDTVLQSSPLAMLLVDHRQHIVYTNFEARHLLNQGRALLGVKLEQALHNSHPAVRELIASGRDGLVTLEIDAETHTYHLSRGSFNFNSQRHELYLFKQMTREINRREVDIWKKVIRLISHELNNSLAPISSLAHSGKILIDSVANSAAASDNATAKNADSWEKLTRIFDTISERSCHLSDFISGYAGFAKLPAPRPTWIDWREFIGKLQLHTRFHLDGPLPQHPGWGDPVQLEQVMINLLKNAHEAGGAAEAVKVSIAATPTAVRVEVTDRGSGMPENVLKQALLPFYSTKTQGTGLGLALCHEVIEGHEGYINFRNRQGGGLRVSLFLPLPATALKSV